MAANSELAKNMMLAQFRYRPERPELPTSGL